MKNNFGQFIVLTIVIQAALCFKNPVIKRSTLNSFYGASVLTHNHMYYLLTADFTKKYLQIQTSADLQDWSNTTNVMGPESYLYWMEDMYDYMYGPSGLSYINDIFVIYLGTSSSCIGVATSKNIMGPYLVQKQPLLCNIDSRKEYFYYPSMLNDSGTLYLYYNHYDGQEMTIEARQLSKDGLTFADPNAFSVALKSTENWESQLYASTVVKHSGAFYLIYEIGCMGLFVARSFSAKGPFEKTGSMIPMIDQFNDGTEFPRYSTIVKDFTGNTVILYASGINGCHLEKSYISAANLVWKNDLWPTVINLRESNNNSTSD